jgi:hypothetical protein
VKPARLCRFLLAAAAVTFSIPLPLRSQEPTDTPPKPAARTIPPLGSDNTQDQVTDDNATNYRPDDRPLTGLQNPTIGVPELRHSYWLPGFSYNNAIQSNGFSQGGGSSWVSTNYLQGNLTLLEAWNRGQLGINYSGGGYFSNDSRIGSGEHQQLGLIQVLDWARWQLTFLDQFSYLPGSAFGFGVGTNLSFAGVGGSPGSISPGLGSGLSPDQSIFSSSGPRFSNAFGSQVNYLLSRRSSLTLGGVFGILRFTNSGNVNNFANIESNDVVLNAGYNYAITRKDTVGVVYRFSAYHFLGQPQAIGDHSPQLSYGRKITGRLALQLSGGAEITTFRVPVGGETHHVGGAGHASFNYAFKRGGVDLSYSHGVTSGSGIFLGATTDQIRLDTNRQLTRQWNGNVQVGYARNRNVVSGAIGLPGVTGTNSASASYDSFYFGGGASRPLGRNLNFTSAYTAYIQHTNAGATCVIGTCGTNYTSHQITLGLSWHTRPFVLR